MAHAIRLSSAEAVKALIAEVVLGPPAAAQRIGAVTLRPHQADAVSRIERAIKVFGGALLCDEVGMGKTFVAAAIAQAYHHPLIVAPAALRTMWSEAMASTRLDAEFVSFERLSRQSLQAAGHDLVIVDEAHHARNPSARRYGRLASLTRNAPVLMMSATPIHNRERDLTALLSLFLGGRAKSLTPVERSRCIIRRERRFLEGGAGFPRIAPGISHELPDEPAVVADLLAIPSPVPVRNGSPERHLFARGMIHQWASSEAALFEAIRRRRARGLALIASLESGVLPTAHEIAAWVYDEGVLQLGFAELLSKAVEEPIGLLSTAREHLNGLEEFMRRHSPGVIDESRAAVVRAIRTRHPRARVVAFAQYAETIAALYRRLAGDGRVAMLTAKGARISSGRVPREEIVSQFQPQAAEGPAAARVELLLSTDLLSEGVNLQGAQVVTHLDLPWTAARLEQRVGRVARIGSPHGTVFVYAIRPPASARAYLESEDIISAKWMAAHGAIGNSACGQVSSTPACDERQSIPVQTERLRAVLESWRSGRSPIGKHRDPCVASIRSSAAGFIAALGLEDGPAVVCGTATGVVSELETLIEKCSSDHGPETPTLTCEVEAALRTIEDWIEIRRASGIAGLAPTSELVSRRRLLDRVDASVRGAAPHLRPARARLAAAARVSATRFLAAAAEQELASLERSPLPDDQWLRALADFSPPPGNSPDAEGSARPRIIAVLLLSPPPPASGCGAG